MITAIWAQSKNNVIGSQGGLPWSLPDDMAFFREQTIHQAVVMGRRTFDSFGGHALPKRLNIILTHNPTFRTDDPKIKIVHSPQEASIIASQVGLPLFVIGGAAVYDTFLDLTDRILVTMVHAEISGDTFAPQIDPKQFQLTSRHHHNADEKHLYSFDFLTYLRKTGLDQV